MKKFYLVVTLFICFFVFSLETNAQINDYFDKEVIYNYDSSSVLDTVDKRFLGENGYLEKVRKALETTNRNYFMFFTKDDIYVFESFYNNFSIYLGFNYEPSNSLTYLTLSTYSSAYDKSYYMSLSDFDNLDSFVSRILSNYTFVHSIWNSKYITVSSFHKCNESFLNDNYNYFTNCSGNKDFDYIIPYFFRSNSYTYSFKFGRGQVSTTLDTVGYSYKPRLNGTTDVTGQTYYEKFGVLSKTHITSSYLYDVSTLVPVNKLFDFKTDFNWYCDTLAEIQDVRVYGRVKNGTGYYWEDIKFKGNYDSSYFSPDYTEPSINNGICSMSIKNNIDNSISNLDKYEDVYVQFSFKPSTVKNTRVHSCSVSDSSIKCINNDVAQYMLIDETYIDSDHVYAFSTKNGYYSDYFYYTILPKNNLPYLEMGNYNYETKKNVYDYNYTDSFQVNSVYYPLIQRLSVNNFGSIDTTLLYFRVGYDNSNKLHSIKFAYSPLNLYVDYAKFNDLKNNFDVDYIDKDGNINTDTVVGDYNYEDGNVINISSLFSSVIKGASSFVNCGIEILNLVTSFFSILPNSVQSLLLLIFLLSVLVIFIRMIM